MIDARTSRTARPAANLARRVAITGLGFVTPIGHAPDVLWTSLVEGRSAVGQITRFAAADYPTRIAAEVLDFEPLRYMGPETARQAGRCGQFALAAARAALADAGLSCEHRPPQDIGVVVATAFGGIETIVDSHQRLLAADGVGLGPSAIWSVLSSSLSNVVATHVGLAGPAFGLASACAGGTHAIGEAAEIIRRGDAVAMLAGGAEAAITPLILAGFCRMRAVSERNDQPHRASRPFDRERDGFVVGEGAAMLVLENMRSARARGARVLAEVLGYGASADCHHPTDPDPSGAGAVRSMRAALRRAGISPDAVDYLNAHSTGTRVGDVAETRAIRTVLGRHTTRVPVSSTKSMHAHLLGASGALETAVCVLAIQHSLIPPTINLDAVDPDCALDHVAHSPRRTPVAVAMNNSFGFGGHNATVIVAHPDYRG